VSLFSRPPLRSLNCRPQAATKPPAALRRAVPPRRGRHGAAVDAFYARLPATSQPIRSLSAAEPATNPGPSWREG
jgi:hypothetical protein